MIISVASGKGGTGKTTVSTNMAVSIERELKLLDCDVEEPNAHLFLKPDLSEPQSVTTFVPNIIDQRCTGCGECVQICQFNALTVIADKVLVFPELCHSCKGCQVVCPEQAITAGSRELGISATGKRGLISFIHGCLRIGEAMSPPLINHLRTFIKPDELVIIDAPPGTSCPAIASMKDCDFVLLVTEPTPFGLHDLKLAYEAVKVLGIPCGLVINRSDLGDESVRDYAHREFLPILLEIPFDRRIAEIYSRGQMLVDEEPAWRQTFSRLFSDITKIIEEGQENQ
jgi:MinD superfamily P-loop ATPase